MYINNWSWVILLDICCNELIYWTDYLPNSWMKMWRKSLVRESRLNLYQRVCTTDVLSFTFALTHYIFLYQRNDSKVCVKRRFVKGLGSVVGEVWVCACPASHHKHLSSSLSSAASRAHSHRTNDCNVNTEGPSRNVEIRRFGKLSRWH